RLADHRDLPRALDQAQVVENGGEVRDREVREPVAKLRGEVAGPRKAALERIGREIRDSPERQVPALRESLRGKEGNPGRQRRAPLQGPREMLRQKIGPVNRLDARELRDLRRVFGGEDLPLAALASLVAVGEVERRPAGARVEDEVRVGDLDA